MFQLHDHFLRIEALYLHRSTLLALMHLILVHLTKAHVSEDPIAQLQSILKPPEQKELLYDGLGVSLGRVEAAGEPQLGPNALLAGGHYGLMVSGLVCSVSFSCNLRLKRLEKRAHFEIFEKFEFIELKNRVFRICKKWFNIWPRNFENILTNISKQYLENNVMNASTTTFQHHNLWVCLPSFLPYFHGHIIHSILNKQKNTRYAWERKKCVFISIMK